MNEAEQQAALLRVVVDRPGPVVPDRFSWELWALTAGAERVLPLLYRLVDTVPTDLTDARAEIRLLLGPALSRCVQLEHHLVAVARVLADHGIHSAVLKGAATAHLDYPDPSWREFHDIDLLIDPADRSAAVALLARDGWVQGYALPRRHEEFTHAVTLVHNGIELDLHQRIAHRALGVLVPTRGLLDATVTFEIAGARLGALRDVDRLIHAALHAVTSRGPYRHLSSVADVLLLADRRPNLAAEVLARAERWRVRSLVERGVLGAYATAQLPVHPEWVDAMRGRTRHRDRLVDRAYLGPDRRPVAEELAYLRLLDGWDDRWRYARGFFSVDADYAAQHGRAGMRAQAEYVWSKLRSRSS